MDRGAPLLRLPRQERQDHIPGSSVELLSLDCQWITSGDPLGGDQEPRRAETGAIPWNHQQGWGLTFTGMSKIHKEGW